MSQNYDMREDEEIRAWFGVKSMSSVDMLPVFHSVVSRISRVGSLGQRADILTSIGFESEFQVLDNVSVSNNYSSSYFQRYYMAYREEVADFADWC
ncbi:MAG TPA: hypothetical protein VJN71_02340 [Nitrososphaerales archaeon]|nr:hypothetical protein [Nitrososphaerales archaeon]